MESRRSSISDYSVGSIHGGTTSSEIKKVHPLRKLNNSIDLGKSPRSDGSLSTSRSGAESTTTTNLQLLTIDDIKNAIEVKNTEILEMKLKINLIQNKITELETEKDTYVFQIGEIKKRYARDVRKLEEELAASNEASNSMEDKLSRVQKIEEGIIQLYLEVRDRTIEVVREDDDERRELEENLERNVLKSENPLVILDRLKANLRTLLAFQEDFEVELKNQINQRVTDVEERVDEMQQRIEELELEQEQLKENEIRAIQIKNDAINSKKMIIDESNKRIAEMKAENVKLVSNLRELEVQISQLHERLDSRDQKLRDRAIEMTKIDKLDDRMLKDKNKHQFDKNRFKSEHYKIREIYDKELNYYTKALNEKVKMEAEVAEIKKTIDMYKQNANRKKVLELEQRDVCAQKKLQQAMDELKEVSEKLRATKTKVVNLRKDNTRIKQKIQQLFTASLNDEKRIKEDEIRIQQHFKDNTDNQPMASHYKKLYQQKEKEVEELNKRVKHMVLLERQEAKQQKNFEQERNRLQEKLTKLRQEAMNIIPDDAWKTEEDLRKNNQELERRLRDYENMRSLARTQTEALSKLTGLGGATLLNQSDLDSLPDTRLPNRSRNSTDMSLMSRRPSSASASRSIGKQNLLNDASGRNSAIDRRPTSAGSTRRSSKLKVGAARSTIIPGDLIAGL